jgi:hypothetical protein
MTRKLNISFAIGGIVALVLALIFISPAGNTHWFAPLAMFGSLVGGLVYLATIGIRAARRWSRQHPNPFMMDTE